jgi:hypothetical protein
MDLQIAHHDGWEDILTILGGWRPDGLILQLHNRPIPPALWQMPVPIIALAENLHRQWHSCRQLLHYCDLVLTDAAGVEALKRAAIAHAWQAGPSESGGIGGEESGRVAPGLAPWRSHRSGSARHNASIVTKPRSHRSARCGSMGS